MKTSKTISLIALCTGLGVAAGAWAPSFSVRSAHAASGTWACAVADRLPNMKDAREWKGAKAIEQGMNLLAPSATTGQIVVAKWKDGYPDIICAKN